MKRIVWLAVLVLGLGNADAQRYSYRTKIRQNYSPVMTSPDESTSQTGLHFGGKYFMQTLKIQSEAFDTRHLKINGSESSAYGLSMDLFIGNHFSIGAEFNYAKYQQSLADMDNRRTDIRLNYLEIPVLLGLHSDYGRTFSIFLEAGPQFSLNMGTSLREDQGADSSYHAVLAVKPVRLGLAIGGGVEMDFGRKKGVHLGLGLRGVKGFTKIDDTLRGIGEKEYYILNNASLNTLSPFVSLKIKI